MFDRVIFQNNNTYIIKLITKIRVRNMPTYDYECNECQAQFRVEASLKEKETLKPKCPKCKSEDTFQLFKKITTAEDMSTGEDPMAGMPPPGAGGGMPPMGMGGMPPMGGCPPGMCGPGGFGM